MDEDISKKLNKLGIFTLKDVNPLGIDAKTLSRWAKSQVIQRVDQGIYWYPKGELRFDELDYALACKIFGKDTYITGLSALHYYNYLDFSPREIWVSVVREKNTKRKRFRLLRTQINRQYGIDDHTFFKISNIERTIVEALHFSTKIGIDIALRSALTAINRSETSPEKLAAMSIKIGTQDSYMKHWDTINAAYEALQHG